MSSPSKKKKKKSSGGGAFYKRAYNRKMFGKPGESLNALS
jgi:hypothetical protein